MISSLPEKETQFVNNGPRFSVSSEILQYQKLFARNVLVLIFFKARILCGISKNYQKSHSDKNGAKMFYHNMIKFQKGKKKSWWIENISKELRAYFRFHCFLGIP